METQWLLDNHKSPVRSPKRYGQQSAIYQKRNYNGMKKLESFQIRLVGSGIHGPLDPGTDRAERDLKNLLGPSPVFLVRFWSMNLWIR